MISFQQLVAQAKSEIQEINSQTLFDNKNQYPLLIDVRESQELASGQIAGSIAVSRGLLESKIGSLLDSVVDSSFENKNKIPVVVYCRSGARSALAAKTLQEMGLISVYSLAGGINAWQSCYPIIKHEPDLNKI